MSAPVVVQALDGRWNFGPPALEEALRSEEFGAYATAADASQAALGPVDEPRCPVCGRMGYFLTACPNCDLGNEPGVGR